MNEGSSLKRVKRRIIKPPNPLFESWLKEWKDEAKKNGSEMQYCFGKALKSLQKYPFRLETGKECFILENFGAKLCMKLDKKLDEYRKQCQSSSQSLPPNVTPKCSETDKDEQLEAENTLTEDRDAVPTCMEENMCESIQKINELVKKRKSCMDSPSRSVKYSKDSNKSKGRNKKCDYLPAFRSGGYAIILTLHKNCKKMSKAELELQAQKFCDSSFKRSPDSYYTAWSTMSVLLKKGLVEKSGKPPR